MTELTEQDTLRVQKIRVRSGDGAESDASVFAGGSAEPRAVVVCTPAMGVAASYYEGLARELARHGLGVVTAELRGIGSSFEVRGSEHDFEKTLAAVELPVLALSFEGDVFAPSGAVEHLLGRMPRSKITRRRLQARDLGARSVDHFRWAKHPVPVAEVISRWMTDLPG
jgi:predicted alpha/beta hydrolase